MGKYNMDYILENNRRDTYLNEWEDYGFDVYVASDLVFLAVTTANGFDEDGFPLRNIGRDFHQSVYLAALAQRDANLTCELPRGSYYRSSMDEEHFLRREDPFIYSPTGTMYYDSIARPEIDWVQVARDGSGSPTGIQICGTLGRLMYSEDEVAFGGTGFMLRSGDNGMIFTSDKYVESGMDPEYVRTYIRGALRNSDSRTPLSKAVEGRSFSFLALSRPKDGAEGESAIELFDWDMNCARYWDEMKKSVVLDKGYIDHFELIQTPANEEGSTYRRMVLYTAKEIGPDGDSRDRLYGLYIEPIQRSGKDMSFEVTKYTYDLTIPSGKFKIVTIDDTPYIYWLATAPRLDEAKPDVYRLWAAAFDMSTNTVATPSVFSEFRVPRYDFVYRTNSGETGRTMLDLVPQDVHLTGTGTAYLSAVPDAGGVPERYREGVPQVFLESIPEMQKPVLELQGMVVEDTTVAAGDFEDTTIVLMNAGNMGISSFDLELYTVEDGKTVVSETLHADCLHPEKSSLTMSGTAEPITLPEGRQAIYRNSDFDYTARQRDWVLAHEKKAYKVYLGDDGPVLQSVETVDSQTQYLQTDMMMPGALASFTGTLKIPESWSGDKTLYLRVGKLSAYSNWERALANAAGAGNGILSNAAAPRELTWALDEKSGKLVLQEGGIASNSAAANDAQSGFIVGTAEVGDPVPLMTAYHDIEITHRVYPDGDGSDLLDIVVSNYADNKDSFKLTCAVYVDGAEEPCYVNLHHYEKALASRAIHTITMPISALVDDPEAHSKVRVEINAIGRDESAYANNEFTVFLGGQNALRFTKQPRDVTVQEGEDVSFGVEVAGGRQPYAFQWQVWNPRTGEWVDLKGFTEPTIAREDIEKKWDGAMFRCVVTDAAGAKTASEAATLTVRDKVPTGDGSDLPLYLAVALVALALLWLLRRREIKEAV